MLVEIQCDKLIKHGEIRKPIQFHAGLNTVIGDDHGFNSIGKSTFLMILEFVFGGKDYVNICLDVQENVRNIPSISRLSLTISYIIFQEAMSITGMYSVAMRIMNCFRKIAR